MLEAPDFSVPHFFEFEAVHPRPKVQVELLNSMREYEFITNLLSLSNDRNMYE